jgi:hypothetical protein
MYLSKRGAINSKTNWLNHLYKIVTWINRHHHKDNKRNEQPNVDEEVWATSFNDPNNSSNDRRAQDQTDHELFQSINKVKSTSLNRKPVKVNYKLTNLLVKPEFRFDHKILVVAERK